MQNVQSSSNTKCGKFGESVATSSVNFPPLGIITKYYATPVNTSFSRPHDFILQDQSAKLLPTERVRYCLKNRVSKLEPRKIVYTQNTDKTHWDNVQRCGSIWACPVCAKQVTEVRRAELVKAKDLWLKENKEHSIMLLTLTTPHTIKDDLNKLLKQQARALKYFFGDRLGIKILGAMGKFGFIKSTEVTTGDNGFHPHYHILLFLKRYLSCFERDTFKRLLFDHWANCCIKAKIPAPNEKHGLDLRNGDFASKYIGKWGLEHELTKSHSKKGKKGSLTPFDLLNLSIQDEPINGVKPSYLFKKYYEAFKGKRQLFWSKGLKDYFKINEVSDEEIAEQTTNKAIKLLDVSSQIFYLLRNAKMRHLALEWAKNDYKNDCLDSGEYWTNIFELLQEKNYISPYAVKYD
jgi:hypothetical protein